MHRESYNQHLRHRNTHPRTPQHTHSSLGHISGQNDEREVAAQSGTSLSSSSFIQLKLAAAALAAHPAEPAAASSSRYELLMDLLLCLLRPRRWPSALERQSRGLRKSLEADFSSVFGSNSGSMMKYTSTSLNSASSHSEVKASN